MNSVSQRLLHHKYCCLLLSETNNRIHTAHCKVGIKACGYPQTELSKTKNMRWELPEKKKQKKNHFKLIRNDMMSWCFNSLDLFTTLKKLFNKHKCHFYSEELVWMWPPQCPCSHICTTSQTGIVNLHHPRRFLLIAFLWLMSEVRNRFFPATNRGNY